MLSDTYTQPKDTNSENAKRVNLPALLFYFLIFLIPFPEYEPFSSVWHGFTLILVVGMAITILGLIYMLFQPISPFWPRGGAKIWVFLYLLFLFIFHYSEDPFRAYGVHLGLLITCLCFVRSEKNILHIYWVSLLGLLPNCYLALKSVVVHGDRWSIRAQGAFGDPNYFALALLVGVAFAYGLFKIYSKKSIKLLLALVMMFLIWTLIKTGSRGGFIALIPMFLLMFLYSKRKLISFSLLVLSVPIFMIFAQNILFRMEGTTLSRPPDARSKDAVSSTMGRFQQQIAGLNMIKDRPFIGVGLKNFKPLAPYYNPLASPKIAHNTYLEVAAEQGLPAFVLFIGCLTVTFKNILFLRSLPNLPQFREIKEIAVSLTLGLSGYSVGMLFLSAQRQKYLWLMIIIAMCLNRVVAQISSATDINLEEVG